MWKFNIINYLEKIDVAIKVLNESSIKTCFIVDENGFLVGSITDGDIRRGILRGLSINDNAMEFANKVPTTVLTENLPKTELLAFRKNGFNAIPVIDSIKKIVQILNLNNANQQKIKNNPIVIMAGGLGKRLGELTKDCPKPMLKIGGKPILQLIIENVREFGFSDIILSVNFMSDVIEDFFGDGSRFGLSIKYLKETKKLGTAGSLSLLEKTISDPIIVMNGDLLTNIDYEALLSFFSESKSEALMCVREYDVQVPFGVVRASDDGTISRIDEKPIQKFLVNAGVYVLSPKVLDSLVENEHVDMPKLLERLMKNDKNVKAFPLREYWLDIGRLDDLERAKVEVFDVFKK